MALSLAHLWQTRDKPNFSISEISKLAVALEVLARVWHLLWRSRGGPGKCQALACLKSPNEALLWQVWLKYGAFFGTPLADQIKV